MARVRVSEPSEPRIGFARRTTRCDHSGSQIADRLLLAGQGQPVAARCRLKYYEFGVAANPSRGVPESWVAPGRNERTRSAADGYVPADGRLWQWQC